MPEISQPDLEAFFAVKPLLSKYNGADGIAGKIGELERDVVKERRRREQAEEKTPPTGSVVHTAEQAKRLENFEALGKSPEELAAAKILAPADAARLEAFDATGLKPDDVAGLKTKADELEKKDTARTRRDTLAAGFKAEGLDEKLIPGALKLLDGAALELQQGKRKNGAGEDVEGKYLSVTLPGEGQKARTLAELAKEVEEFSHLAPGTPGGGTEGDREWKEQPTGDRSTGGGYDASAEGKKRAEEQKAGRGGASQAFQ